MVKVDLPTPVLTHDTSDRPHSIQNLSGFGLTTVTKDDELVLSWELGLCVIGQLGNLETGAG